MRMNLNASKADPADAFRLLRYLMRWYSEINTMYAKSLPSQVWHKSGHRIRNMSCDDKTSKLSNLRRYWLKFVPMNVN